MSAPPAPGKEQRFDWPLCHGAEQYVLDQLERFQQRHAFAAQLARRMQDETGTLLLDWIDHLIVPAAEADRLPAVGYLHDPRVEAPPGFSVLWHPEAMLPRVLLPKPSAASSTAFTPVLALRCESVADFLVAHQLHHEPLGAPFTRYRSVTVAEENGTRLLAVERRGYLGFVPAAAAAGAESFLKAVELWRIRRRQFAEDADGFRQTLDLIDRLVGLAGRDLACHAVFTAEREYWQGRNQAGQVQKARQDRLGVGWANHDHHTFRSSRPHFVDLMRALERLGFERRERYYAGAQAGWGAQILEQPVEGLVAFCDVDLEPDETSVDFSRQTLPPSRQLGTIGLWVGLHGESFLEAGMHHLECRFDHRLLREQLAGAGIQTMKPFSDFPFLKQAFTAGERWRVRPERADRLLRQGLIDAQQFQTFVKDGAIGSHLENLQRKGGFKGFNQKSVSVIIQATDPRLQ